MNVSLNNIFKHYYLYLESDTVLQCRELAAWLSFTRSLIVDYTTKHV